MKSIPYGRQDIQPQDIQAVTETLQHDFLTQGPAVEAFEDAFADYVGAEYAVAVANGTAALHLCVLALGLKEGQKVITTPITFAASANCVRYCGGEVEFVDIDPKTGLLDFEQVKQRVEAAPAGTYAGIIPVDFMGHAVDLEKFRALADAHNLWLVEDACHAPGGHFTDSQGNMQLCGNGAFVDLAIFSFHPVKHIACGEGGMITTRNKDLYEALLLLRTHGITKSPDLLQENHGGWYYEMQTLGYNYRLSDIHASLGLSQLQRADAGLKRRREIAVRYETAFRNTAVQTFAEVEGHAYHLYVIRTENRKALYDYLREKQIFAQVHYIPVHTLPYYRALGNKPEDCPHAMAYYEKCLSLPMFPSLTDEEQDFVIQTVLEFVES